MGSCLPGRLDWFGITQDTLPWGKGAWRNESPVLAGVPSCWLVLTATLLMDE